MTMISEEDTVCAGPWVEILPGTAALELPDGVLIEVAETLDARSTVFVPRVRLELRHDGKWVIVSRSRSAIEYAVRHPE